MNQSFRIIILILLLPFLHTTISFSSSTGKLPGDLSSDERKPCISAFPGKREADQKALHPPSRDIEEEISAPAAFSSTMETILPLFPPDRQKSAIFFFKRIREQRRITGSSNYGFRYPVSLSYLRLLLLEAEGKHAAIAAGASCEVGHLLLLANAATVVVNDMSAEELSVAKSLLDHLPSKLRGKMIFAPGNALEVFCPGSKYVEKSFGIFVACNFIHFLTARQRCEVFYPMIDDITSSKSLVYLNCNGQENNQDPRKVAQDIHETSFQRWTLFIQNAFGEIGILAQGPLLVDAEDPTFTTGACPQRTLFSQWRVAPDITKEEKEALDSTGILKKLAPAEGIVQTQTVFPSPEIYFVLCKPKLLQPDNIIFHMKKHGFHTILSGRTKAETGELVDDGEPGGDSSKTNVLMRKL